ncbi:DUF1104 domain-containing protein [Arcobacter caeni]|jgi:hypothetical protein|uniref:DUF1104 domain-containing protein n=1 Tax=Arcobacter caeni TaxID=1912877 RepID=A0A363D1G4_9BACT|nr:DUF1104 domain-containing protein [Arcobacter caeni]PUE65149.1 hypothetical protein B0174_04950 [Arcobacter caeni]
MKKIAIIFLLLFTFLFAKHEDYSEMSTQELIAIIGYVKDENKAQFIKELNLRIPTMTQDEKVQFEQNIQELKQNEN